jgi:hypothetical protein
MEIIIWEAICPLLFQYDKILKIKATLHFYNGCKLIVIIIPFIYFLLVLRQDLTMCSRLVSQSSCLHCQNARVTGAHHHTQLGIHILKSTPEFHVPIPISGIFLKKVSFPKII